MPQQNDVSPASDEFKRVQRSPDPDCDGVFRFRSDIGGFDGVIYRQRGKTLVDVAGLVLDAWYVMTRTLEPGECKDPKEWIRSKRGEEVLEEMIKGVRSALRGVLAEHLLPESEEETLMEARREAYNHGVRRGEVEIRRMMIKELSDMMDASPEYELHEELMEFREKYQIFDEDGEDE